MKKTLDIPNLSNYTLVCKKCGAQFSSLNRAVRRAILLLSFIFLLYAPLILVNEYNISIPGIYYPLCIVTFVVLFFVNTFMCPKCKSFFSLRVSFPNIKKKSTTKSPKK